MRTPALPSPRRIAAGAGLALLVAGLTPITAAEANPAGTGLVISEVYGGGGNTGASYTNDFIELYNPTSSAISVTGWSVQYRSATGTAPTLTNLTGSVPAGGHFLIQESAGATPSAALPTPDATGTLTMSGTNGVVILASNQVGVTAVGNLAGTGAPANVVDVVGYGTTPTTFETVNTGVALTNTTSATRQLGADTDHNANDFTEVTPTPQNSGPSTPAALDATPPGAKAGQVGSPIANFTLAATGGTPPYSWTATGLPGGVTVATSGAVSGTPTTTGDYTVEATVTDSAGTPATDTVSFAFSITNAAQLVPIAEIQGTGTTTPFSGQQVRTQGVVTASYPTGGLNGFYIQTPGADTPNASDAIFVYGGTSGFSTYPQIGDSVGVVGQATEFGGATQIAASDAGVTQITPSLGTVTPKTSIPGTTCALPGTACDTLANLVTDREAMEGELVQPTAPFTVTDGYDGSPFWPGNTSSSGMFGEIGLAAGSAQPLVAPTELYDAQDESALVAARTAYNNAHRIVMDDGSSLNYAAAANTGQAFPWLTATHAVRVGAAVTFPQPVVFTEGFSTWRILPTTRVVGEPSTGQPQIAQTRAANQAPQNVGGDVKLATFNVLNYFPTTGNEYVTAGGVCTYYTDRQGNQTTTNQCGTPAASSGNGPRGAANAANLQRQQDKIVAAINGSGAHIVSLEELENSAKLGKDRDFAIGQLVNGLNVDNAGKWAFVPSPTGADLPALADEDVIRTGFIYQPARVAPVGTSRILVGSAPFDNAREPLAQAFKQVGTPDSRAFAVIVNHFKSKGSGADDGTGQGNANPDRVAQANALVAFADQFKSDRGITRVFLAGDFNSYTHEDPIQVLNAAGYTNLESTSNPDEETYSFDGMVGSLDHVLVNDAALADVTGVDIWDINGGESVYYEYGRTNSNVTNLFTPTPFRSSDHSPEIVGIKTQATPVDVQILATNDFHGRIQNDSTSAAAGAAIMAGAVKQLRSANPNTVFAAAGDLIGASTFESFIDKDKPTIDALNEAGLEVSAAGNHEFDQGYNDLVNRVMAPYDAQTNPQGGANWKYIAANVKLRANGADALTPSWTKTMNGVKVGFVGAVTEHLPELVSPGGITQIQVTDIVDAVNAEATSLTADGADIVVMLVHEGAAGTSCATMGSDPTSDFGSIINGVNADVDAIVSGHTHLEYNCSFPVADWADRPVKERPVVSAGQYGAALNQLVYTVNPDTGVIQAKTQNVLKLKSGTATGSGLYPTDPATQQIVDAAVSRANVLGAVELGKIGGAFYRAKLADGTTENRGGESSLGNLVAEIQRWSTRGEESGSAQIAFMNPGGLRADLLGNGTGAFPRPVTYKQAANVQPFANTLVNLRLTGAQIKATLEQQWQPSGAARPFLKLGISQGFDYTYDPSKAQGSRITGMWLNGTAIDPTTVYSVTVNSFLSTGGDNFTALNGGTNKRDTGKTDLQAQVDYFAAFANGATPLPVDFSQRGVGVAFPAGAPASYGAGDDVAFALSSLSMTGPGDPADTQVEIRLGTEVLGTAAVTTARMTGLPGFDEVGTANVSVEVPACLTSGADVLTITGATTGTTVTVPVELTAPACPGATTVTGSADSFEYGAAGSVAVQVDPASATGTVTVKDGSTVLGTATLFSGEATVALAARSLPAGTHVLSLEYSGDSGHSGSIGSVTVVVTEADSSVTGTAASFAYGSAGSVAVEVAPTSATGTVTVSNGSTVLGTATLASGKGTVTLAAKSLPAGSHTLSLAYSGDANHQASTGSVTVVVTKAESSVTGTAASVVYGTAGSVKVSVAPAAASGTVTVASGGTVLGTATLASGEGTIALAAKSLPAGSHTLSLAYSGDANHQASTGSVTVVVTKAESSVTGTAASVVYGDAGSVKVSVAPAAASGTVTVSSGGDLLGMATLASGTGEITIAARTLNAGTHTLTLTYGGDENHQASTDSVTMVVTKASASIDTTVKPAKIKAGKTEARVVVRVDAGGFDPRGKVTLTIGKKTYRASLEDGKVVFELDAFAKPGTYKAKIAYAGSVNVEEATDTVRIKVKRR